MACPYFIPAEIHQGELWPHRERLPLGDGFSGRCGAQPPHGSCDDENLRLHCNLGYADLGSEAACIFPPEARSTLSDSSCSARARRSCGCNLPANSRIGLRGAESCAMIIA